MRISTLIRCCLPTALGAAALALTVAGPAQAEMAATQTASQPVPGMARIWFYRDFEPSVSLNVANVSLNGQMAAVVQPDGSATYRDVLPGQYHITVESYGKDYNQDKDVAIGPGQEVFVKILSSTGWESGGDTFQFHRDTYYVSLVSPQVARAELARRPL